MSEARTGPVTDLTGASWLALLAAAVGLAVLALLLGLAIWHSPRLGLLLTPMIPVAAGWSMVRLSLRRAVE